jgi:hypothetical protein
MGNPFNNLGVVFTGYLPTILAALAVLLVGWLIAYVVSRVVGNLLHRTSVDDRVAGMLRTEQNTATDGPRVTRWVTAAVFWIILLFAVVAFLQVLNLSIVSAPLNLALSSIIGFLPSLFSAVVLLFAAFLLATFLRMVITRVVGASSLSRRVSENAEVSPKNRVSLGETIGNVVYWLVFLLFLPAILGALNLNGILAPVQGMVNEVLAFLPNLLAAALILAVGYFASRIVRQIVVGLLNSVGVDRIGQQVGIPQNERTPNLANALGTLVMVLIMIPVVIAALNALDIPAVSQPAASMLTTVLNAVPLIFGAAVLIALTYFAARLVGNLVAGLLAGIGFDRLFRSLGFNEVTPRMGAEPLPTTGTQADLAAPGWSPSRIAGMLVTIALVLFGVIAAANMLGFVVISTMVAGFMALAGNILLGLAILGLGLYLSSLAERAIRGSGATQANILATAARVAIIVFSGALALRQMGLGEDIVNLAFGLLFGAVAVAFALAFGLGGRDVAARQLDTWRGRLKDMGDRGGSVPTTGGPASSGPASGGSSGFETGGVSSHSSGGETLLRRGGEGDGILPPQESGGDIPTTGFAADQGMEDTRADDLSYHSGAEDETRPGGIVPPFRPDYDEGEDNLTDRKF